MDSVLYDYKSGATAEQIAFDFPTLELAEIHFSIGYYLRHQQEVDQYLADQQQKSVSSADQFEIGSC